MDYGYGRESDGSYDSDSGYGKRRNRRGACESDSDIDEEEAARRYNKKHEKSLTNAWIDRLRRKQASGATTGATLKELLESRIRQDCHGLDDYDDYGGRGGDDGDGYGMHVVEDDEMD